MGYRSDIRIRITKGDFDNLKKDFAKYLTDNDISGNILEELDIYKEHEYTWSNYDCNLNEWVDSTAKCVYFGWNDIKWWSELDYLITDKIERLNAYAVTIFGEDYEDVRVDSREFGCIEVIRKFADNCEYE